MAIELPCYCASLRQAARVISQYYESALRDTEVTITQFTLLSLLDKLKVARVNDIAAALAMEGATGEDGPDRLDQRRIRHRPRRSPPTRRVSWRQRAVAVDRGPRGAPDLAYASQPVRRAPAG